MSDTSEPSAEAPTEAPAAGAAATEDERRQKAAEVNRKRTEEAWLRNKQNWIHDNFPEKRRTG